MTQMQIDWRADDWFSHYHAENISDKFGEWWIEHYGPPSIYSETEEEQREYWVRCAFALEGWNAAIMSSPP